MEEKYYITNIEKKAAINAKVFRNIANGATNRLLENPKKTGIGLGALTATGVGYATSDRKDKNLIKKNIKKGARTYIDANVAGEGAEVIRGLSGLAGAGLALASGKRNTKDIIKKGLAGFAIGDVGSSALVPAVQLRRRTKKELGRTPTKDEYAKVIAGNAGGPALMWSGMYGLKRGKKVLGKMQDNGADVVNGVKKAYKDLSTGITKAVDDGVYDKNFLNTERGRDIQNKAKKSMANAGKKALAIAAPLGVMDEVAQLPSYMATPKNIVDKEKEKIKSSEGVK